MSAHRRAGRAGRAAVTRWATPPGRAAVVGLAGSVVAAPLAARLAHAIDLLDRPGRLKPHAEPVPYLGGLAVAAGIAAAAAAVPGEARRGMARRLPPLLASLVLGTVDDAVDLPVSLRLAGELAVGILVARQAGDTRSPLPARPRSGPPSRPLGQVIARVLVTALATNALNLVDGADGLAAGTALLGALGEAVLLREARRTGPPRGGPAPLQTAPAEPAPGEPALREPALREPALREPARVDATRPELALATGLAGATAGFLWWNRPPARLYLGDGGAYLLGTALAVLASETACLPGNTGQRGPSSEAGATPDATGNGGSAGAGIGWATALLPLSYPLAELAFAVIRRLRGGVAPWVGDRAHLYDRLAGRRWPVPLPVATCLALEAGAVLLAVDASRCAGRRRTWCRTALASGGMLLAGWRGGALRLGA